MSRPPTAGAVLYAKDIERVGAFYAAVAGFEIDEIASDFVALHSPTLQLFIVAPAAAVAARIVVEQPPRRRENTALKLMLPVASLDEARRAATSHGGALNPAAAWVFRGFMHCDGLDPEGNVFQLRQPVAVEVSPGEPPG